MSALGSTRVTRPARLPEMVFAVLGAVALAGAAVLAFLGSFAFLGAASVGMFFVAAALVARAARSPAPRAAALLTLAGIALVVFGLTATPLFYIGWGLVAAATALAIIGRLRKGPA